VEPLAFGGQGAVLVLDPLVGDGASVGGFLVESAAEVVAQRVVEARSVLTCDVPVAASGRLST
jgi:hypothetical protein